jgi:hypothetical protein
MSGAVTGDDPSSADRSPNLIPIPSFSAAIRRAGRRCASEEGAAGRAARGIRRGATRPIPRGMPKFGGDFAIPASGPGSIRLNIAASTGEVDSSDSFHGRFDPETHQADWFRRGRRFAGERIGPLAAPRTSNVANPEQFQSARLTKTRSHGRIRRHDPPPMAALFNAPRGGVITGL